MRLVGIEPTPLLYDRGVIPTNPTRPIRRLRRQPVTGLRALTVLQLF